jgi:hypothetical protein
MRCVSSPLSSFSFSLGFVLVDVAHNIKSMEKIISSNGKKWEKKTYGPNDVKPSLGPCGVVVVIVVVDTSKDVSR